MEAVPYHTPYENPTDNYNYDGNDAEMNRIEEYGDEYNFYPDAAF